MRKGSFYNGSFFVLVNIRYYDCFSGIMSVPMDRKYQKDIDKIKKAVGTGFTISGCE